MHQPKVPLLCFGTTLFTASVLTEAEHALVELVVDVHVILAFPHQHFAMLVSLLLGEASPGEIDDPLDQLARQRYAKLDPDLVVLDLIPLLPRNVRRDVILILRNGKCLFLGRLTFPST